MAIGKVRHQSRILSAGTAHRSSSPARRSAPVTERHCIGNTRRAIRRPSVYAPQPSATAQLFDGWVPSAVHPKSRHVNAVNTFSRERVATGALVTVQWRASQVPRRSGSKVFGAVGSSVLRCVHAFQIAMPRPLLVRFRAMTIQGDFEVFHTHPISHCGAGLQHTMRTPAL